MDIKGALAKIAPRQDLTGEEMRDVMNIIMSGEATPSQIGAFLMGMRVKGETRRRDRRGRLDPAREDGAGRGAGGRHRHRRHRRRRRRNAQHLDRDGDRRRRGGRAGRQARQPGAVARNPAPPTCCRRSGVKLDLTPEQISPLHPRSRHRLHVRAGASSGDEACRPVARRTGHAHHVQPARPAVQPGRRAALHARRLSTSTGSSRSPRRCSPTARSRPGSSTAMTGSTSSRPPARALSPQIKDGNLTSFEVTPEDAGLPRADARRPQGRRSGLQCRRACASLLDGAHGRPIAISCCSMPPRRFIVAGTADTLKQGAATRRRARSTAAAPRRRSTNSSQYQTASSCPIFSPSIESYKREEIAAAKTLRPWNEVVAEAHDAPPVRRFLSALKAQARERRLSPSSPRSRRRARPRA